MDDRINDDKIARYSNEHIKAKISKPFQTQFASLSAMLDQTCGQARATMDLFNELFKRTETKRPKRQAIPAVSLLLGIYNTFELYFYLN